MNDVGHGRRRSTLLADIIGRSPGDVKDGTQTENHPRCKGCRLDLQSFLLRSAYPLRTGYQTCLSDSSFMRVKGMFSKFQLNYQQLQGKKEEKKDGCATSGKEYHSTLGSCQRPRLTNELQLRRNRRSWTRGRLLQADELVRKGTISESGNE